MRQAGETLRHDESVPNVNHTGIPERAGERRNTADVVAVLMRDDDRRDRLRGDTDPAKARNGVPNAESAIDEKSRPPGFDQKGVALAAAA